MTLSMSNACTDPAYQYLPCRKHNPDLWFADDPRQLAIAQQLCAGCPIRAQCLAGALARREPCGVWGGQLVERGRITRKRPRGRGRKIEVERELRPAAAEASGAGAGADVRSSDSGTAA